MSMKRFCIAVCLSFLPFVLWSQQDVRNVILMIGDGMGLAHSYAAYLYNGDSLVMFTMPYTAFAITSCADRKVTDSGAGGTAIATGHKTNYGCIGIDYKGIARNSLLEIAKRAGKSTAMVCTSNITHATPASFVAHVSDRDLQDSIALAYLSENVDVVLGGGRDNFMPDKRKDGLNIADSLKEKGYAVVMNTNELDEVKSDRIVGLFADNHLEPFAKRGNFMEKSMTKALDVVSDNEEGFFMMVEGSKIDMEAHDNRYERMMDELLDFDACVRIALDFARKDGHTLVVVVADHETGGLALKSKDEGTECEWTSEDHTAIPVPVYAYGPGSEQFRGVIQNTDIFWKIYNLMIK